MAKPVEIEFVENYVKMKEAKKEKQKGKALVVEDEEEKDGEDSAEDEQIQEPVKKVSSFSSEQGRGTSFGSESSVENKNVCFKDFEILKCIGEGSFGRVYKGRKKDNGQIIALKVMKKQYLINNN